MMRKVILYIAMSLDGYMAVKMVVLTGYMVTILHIHQLKATIIF